MRREPDDTCHYIWHLNPSSKIAPVLQLPAGSYENIYCFVTRGMSNHTVKFDFFPIYL
jgi:hypothetical protein